MSVSIPKFPSHRLLTEPELAFHAERDQDRHVHPLKGLLAFGPYSRSLAYQVLDPIRVAAIFPCGMSGHLNGLFAQLEQRFAPRERRQYLVDFPGFSRTFGVRVVRAQGNSQFEIPKEFDSEIARSKQPHLTIAEKITQAVAALQTQRSEFDVLMILLPERWKEHFFGSDEPDSDFDLHHYIKAVTAAKGIPTQIVREGGALTYFCRASVMWRLSIALYTKAGGVPWKLSHTDPDVAYLGLSYAMRAGVGANRRFVTCCSQVFDADGSGLEFVAYETTPECVEQDNPYLSRADMRRVLARSLALYQRRHAGRPPKRVVVHKTTAFQPQEVDGCFDALSNLESLDLLQVQQDCVWRGIHADLLEGKAQPGGYPCLRGSYLLLGGRDVLLWTQGNAPRAVGGKDYFKEGKGIPAPLLLSRFAGHGGFEDSCRWVLALTKMNWNNDSLYDRLPVTLSYATILAQTLKRMPELRPQPYQFRFFM